MKILLLLISVLLISCTNEPKPAKVAVAAKLPEVIGHLAKIKGTVLKNNNPISIGEGLSEGDTIETKDKSFARLQMNDETSINLAANSKIVLKKYQIESEDRIVDVNLIVGKIRTHFRKKLEGTKGSLKVTTKSVTFGVRGTEFITQNSSQGKTKMFLLEGKVVLSKKKQNVEEQQEIEVKPMEMVTMEDTTDIIETKVVKEEDLAQVTQDEEMSINLDSVKVDEPIAPIEEPAPEVKSTEVNSDGKVRDLLFSLEHGFKALPMKADGKIVYFENNETMLKTLPKDKNGQIISIDPSADNGDKKYRIPVIGANGQRTYLPVSEKMLLNLISKSSNLGVTVPRGDYQQPSQDRQPASLDK